MNNIIYGANNRLTQLVYTQNIVFTNLIIVTCVYYDCILVRLYIFVNFCRKVFLPKVDVFCKKCFPVLLFLYLWLCPFLTACTSNLPIILYNSTIPPLSQSRSHPLEALFQWSEFSVFPLAFQTVLTDTRQGMEFVQWKVGWRMLH